MALHEEFDENYFSDYRYNDEEVSHKKKIRRMLEDRLEQKRLRNEFKDDFDELDGEFNWDDIDK